MRYIEVKIHCKSGESWQIDLLIESMGELGYDTFEEFDGGFNAYIAAEQFEEESLKSILYQAESGLIVEYEVKEIKQENWNAVWESNFNPISIADACYVRATFHEPNPNFKYEIIIDPKMSFGTGHHQTTSMMMEYVLETDNQNKEVLDMGCGTGILAILSVKKGAKSVLAVDYDPVCIDSVEENKILNQVQDKIESRLGSIEVVEVEGEKFDIIYANINRNILLNQITHYFKVLRNNSFLYISGFFVENDLNFLIEECEKIGFKYKNSKNNEAWAAACFEKL